VTKEMTHLGIQLYRKLKTTIASSLQLLNGYFYSHISNFFTSKQPPSLLLEKRQVVNDVARRYLLEESRHLNFILCFEKLVSREGTRSEQNFRKVNQNYYFFSLPY
jgi:hypothetical protein